MRSFFRPPAFAEAVLGFLRPHWKLTGVSVALSFGEAIVEGLTMSLLAVVAGLFTGNSLQASGEELGRFGEWVAGRLAGIDPQSAGLVLIGTVVVLQLTRAFLQFGGKVASIHVQTKIEGDVRERLFGQFMRMSFSQIRSDRTGQLTSVIEHVTYLGLVVSRFNTILTQVLLMVSYLVVLAWLSVPLTLVVAAIGLLMTALLTQVVKRVRAQGRKHTRASVSLSEETLEYLHGIRLLHTYAGEGLARRHVAEVIGRSVSAHRRGLLLQAAVGPAMDSLTVLGISGLLLFGAWQLGGLSGEGVGKLLTFLFVLYRFMPRIRVVNENIGFMVGYLPFVERIAEVLNDVGKEFQRQTGSRPAELKERIELRGVSYRYPGADRCAVRDFSLVVPRGSTVALVGPSGSGKSTVLDLLIGLIQPTSGEIVVDDVRLEDIEWSAWRSILGVVSQETFVFSASVAKNIAFGLADATIAQIEAAARQADAHEFIQGMEQGYDTPVGNQGTRLSGGQRQRIGIARALIRDPEILLLDEATSDLDSQAESEIQASLRRVGTARTTIVVAHRLSTIAHADTILLLEDGVVKEQGRHEELLLLDGRYAELWRLQAQPASRSGRALQ